MTNADPLHTLNELDMALSAAQRRAELFLEQEYLSPASSSNETADRILAHLRGAQTARDPQESADYLASVAALALIQAIYVKRSAG